MNAVVLPFALAVNRPAIVAPYARLSEVLGSDAVYVLARRIGVLKRLAEIGVPPDGIDLAVPLIVASAPGRDWRRP